MKRRYLDVLLWILSGLCIAAVPLSHEDPWLREIICDGIGCFRSDHSAFWNKIFYDLAVGTLLSVIFYVLLVRLPSASKNRRLRYRLTRHYEAMKREIVTRLLFSTTGSADFDSVKQLASDPVLFRGHFYEHDRARWYVAMNKFSEPDAHHFEYVKLAIQDFKTEVDFTIDQAEIAEDEIFHKLKGISLMLQDALSRQNDYDGRKNFFGIIQTLVGGWQGGLIGTVDHDDIALTIQRI